MLYTAISKDILKENCSPHLNKDKARHHIWFKTAFSSFLQTYKTHPVVRSEQWIFAWAIIKKLSSFTHSVDSFFFEGFFYWMTLMPPEECLHSVY